MKMHADEVDIDADLVGGLLVEQFPHLAALPITRFPSAGTVNAIYRLGDHLYAPLPRVARWAQGLRNGCSWLPKLNRTGARAALAWLRLARGCERTERR